MTHVMHSGITCPRRGHASSRLITAIANKTEIVFFGHSLSKLPQDIVVDIAFFTAAFKEGSGMGVAGRSIVFRK